MQMIFVLSPMENNQTKKIKYKRYHNEGNKMKKQVRICIVLLLIIALIPTMGSGVNIDRSDIGNKVNSEKTKWYYYCYIEIEGMTYAAKRSFFFPHFNNHDDTFCLSWEHRFKENATVSLYRSEGGTLLHEQMDVREFHMIGFLGNYNYQGNPLILKGRVLAIQLYDHWTKPR